MSCGQHENPPHGNVQRGTPKDRQNLAIGAPQNRLFPIIGWTEFAFELFQGIAKRLPILYELIRAGIA
jgi:hypothetical protein